MSATLQDIVALLAPTFVSGDPRTVFSGVTHDSRKVRPGYIFVAVPGEHVDGHAFIGRALEAGASAILAMGKPTGALEGVPWIVAPDTRRALGPVASLVYGNPGRDMILVGITGTNGKTTLTFLLESIFSATGAVPGVIGTITYRWGATERSAANTTPEASDLQEMLALMRDEGVTHAIMEVSSHGLHMGRLDGCDFDTGVFTNLTQDHLDYHGSMEEYFLAKSLLFTKLLPASSKTSPVAVVNGDDPYGRRLAAQMRHMPLLTYGTSQALDVYPSSAMVNAEGIELRAETRRGPVRVISPLTGRFNVSNILAAIAVAESLGIDREAIRDGIARVRNVPGRLERVSSASGTVFVDYAHTPAALKNVLEALARICTGRIITVMGCGGDRDKAKRPLMGMEAAAGSDFVVVTSDNPRTEDPLSIIRQVEEGVREYGYVALDGNKDQNPLPPRSYRVIPDRREAIAWAVRALQKSDILLVAGKGHETYQEINGVRYPFDDRQVVLEELSLLSASGHGNARHAKRSGDDRETLHS